MFPFRGRTLYGSRCRIPRIFAESRSDNKYLFDEKGNAYKPDAAEVVFPDEVKYESTYKTLNLIDKAVTSVEGLEGFPDAANIKFFLAGQFQVAVARHDVVPQLRKTGSPEYGNARNREFRRRGVAPANESRYLHLNGNKIKRLDVSNVVKPLRTDDHGQSARIPRYPEHDGQCRRIHVFVEKPGRAAVNFEFTEDTSVERTLKVEYYWWRCFAVQCRYGGRRASLGDG